MAEDDKNQIFVFLQTIASRRFLPHVFDFFDTNFLQYTFFSAQEKNFLVKFDKRLNWFSAQGECREQVYPTPLFTDILSQKCPILGVISENPFFRIS